MGVELLFTEPGSPWMNGVIESLNGRVRDEYLNGELFWTSPKSRPFWITPEPMTTQVAATAPLAI
jgi:transposase InsO family protein